MLFVFLAALLFIAYTYAIFPLLLHFLASKRTAYNPAQPDQWPTVSIVIAAHNEAKSLPAKLDSLQAMDYPPEKVQWVVVSDGSTDDTPNVLEQAFANHPNRIVCHYEQSLGKCGALNHGVEQATGEIIVFMDARQLVSSNALKELVPCVLDPAIGAASGELVLKEDSSLEAANFGLYWRYEKWLRDNESKLFSTTGVTGALYAIRREDFIPNKIGTLLDDFETPISLLKHGKRTLFVSGVYAFDEANDDLSVEFRRKVRNLAGNWQSFVRNSWLFNPRKNPVWWQFISHKLFRLLVPYAMVITLVSSALGDGLFLNLMFFLQALMYALAAASYAELPGTSNKLMNFLKVFLQLNAAAVVATFRFFFGKRAISWR
ncbi:MAG: glycosyltransferase family 2 protein [Granulosicoccus sp.]|nr:glycosyltransferase family 2 protein [Granulosicoccus sp.]